MPFYSRDQILCGLGALVEDEGIGPITANEPFDLAEVEFFGEEVSWVFGVELTEADRAALRDLGEPRRLRFRGVRSFYTLDTLADFFVARVPGVSFEPVDIAGTRCEKAGAFLGLRDVARGVGGVSRFAPSTPIRTHLSRHELHWLWTRIRWISRDALPPLKTRWSDMIASSVFLWVLAMGGTGFASLCLGEPDLFLVFSAAALLGLAPYLILRLFENPLPKGIETFGDLARRLAEANDAARSDKMVV